MKIVSGGQTGVDRAALDAAIENGLSYRGWCPRGGWAEDLPEPPGLLAVYPQLRATPQADPAQRTEWNVRDSSGLMVLVDRHGLAVSKGTEYALACAERLGKPHVVVDLDRHDAVAQAQDWLANSQSPFDLCIGGPRESEAPGIYSKARAFLSVLLEGFT
jgi:hypothetical protein